MWLSGTDAMTNQKGQRGMVGVSVLMLWLEDWIVVVGSLDSCGSLCVCVALRDVCVDDGITGDRG